MIGAWVEFKSDGETRVNLLGDHAADHMETPTGKSSLGAAGAHALKEDFRRLAKLGPLFPGLFLFIICINF